MAIDSLVDQLMFCAVNSATELEPIRKVRFVVLLRLARVGVTKTAQAQLRSSRAVCPLMTPKKKNGRGFKQSFLLLSYFGRNIYTPV